MVSGSMETVEPAELTYSLSTSPTPETSVAVSRLSVAAVLSMSRFSLEPYAASSMVMASAVPTAMFSVE